MSRFYLDIEADDWIMTAGLIGLTRLFDERDLERRKSGIRIGVDQLASLSERYFKYFMETYSIARRDVERMKRLFKQTENNLDKFSENSTEIRNIMSEQLKKVEKYFSEYDEHKNLKALILSVKECKSPEHIYDLRDSIKSYEKIMSKDFINEKLTLNYAKAVIISPFYGQPSFLQAACNSLSKTEHIKKMYEDFVRPAEIELNFQEVLHEGNKENIIHFLKDHENVEIVKGNKPFKVWLKELKEVNSDKEIAEYFRNKVLPCSFIDSLPATLSYEEMMFSPLGISRKNAVNFFWNFDNKIPIPMSALARLVLFMAPIGLAIYQRKLGNRRSSKYIWFSGLVMKESFLDNVSLNDHYRRLRQTGSSFDEVVIGLLDDARERGNRKQESLLFVEVHSDYQSKKTLLDYYHMPPYAADYLMLFGKSLKGLYISEYREQFVRSVLSGADPKQTILTYIREAIESSRHAYGAYLAVRERYRLLLMKNGVSQVDEVKKRDKLVSVAFFQGKDLRNKMVSRIHSQEDKQETYRTSGKKKVEGIAYRLLNSTKAGNKHSFLDTVFRIHVAAGMEVSPIFLDILKEDGLDFETIAGAFITGLLGAEKRNAIQVEVSQ